MKPSELYKHIATQAEEYRPASVLAVFSEYAALYQTDARAGRVKGAQEAAYGAIGTLAAAFPDPNDPAHKLIIGLLDAIVAARSGSTDHILLRSGARVPGTKQGLAHQDIAAFALAGVGVLRNHGASALRARKMVAAILTECGFATRSGDHGERKPITDSALRNWEDNHDDFPVAHCIAEPRKKMIEGDVVANGLKSLTEIEGLIREHAVAFVPQRLAD